MEEDFLTSLVTVFNRDLSKLEEEINLYPTEESLWSLHGTIKNSGGTLCLHLCGNLQHYIGAVLGNSSYQRNRDEEFAARNVPRHHLLDEIRRTKEVVTQTLLNFDHEQLSTEYPIQLWGYPMSTTFFLIHLTGHLNYHLGQLNYHRRLLADQQQSIF
ncbi:MAG: DUF1572 family protein [Cyclobacteriaceae bacterium]|nr:DUF1572 family protein [Cyclobacteriaceae bacterium]